MPPGLHEVTYLGGDQDIEHYPPVRVSSATAIIEDLYEDEDDADRVLQASASATVDNTSANIDIDIGPETADPYRVNACGGNLVVGRTYVIEATGGESEVFKCASAGPSGIRSESPIMGSYSADDARIRGLRLSFTFPTAAAADEDLFDDDRPMRIKWTYTIDGRTVVVGEQIRMVRTNFEMQYLTEVEQEFKNGWYELVKQLPPNPGELRRLVRWSMNRINAQLRGADITPERFLAGPHVAEVLNARLEMCVAEKGYAPKSVDPDTFMNNKRQDFYVTWRRLVLGNPGKDTADLTRDDDVAHANQSRRQGNRVRRA